MGKLKKVYLEEVDAVKEAISTLEAALQADDAEYEIITDEGQPNERSEWINREAFLEFMIENAIHLLSSNVGYLFMDDEKTQKKTL